MVDEVINVTEINNLPVLTRHNLLSYTDDEFLNMLLEDPETNESVKNLKDIEYHELSCMRGTSEIIIKTQRIAIKLINNMINGRKIASQPCNSNLNTHDEIKGDYTTMKGLAGSATIQAMRLYNKHNTDAQAIKSKT